MAKYTEGVMTVPVELARRFSGVALDIGGSVQKYVYRSKEDYDELVHNDIKYGHLHVASFPKSDMSEALEYIRRRAVLSPPSGDNSHTRICTTGFGCSQFGKQICDVLDVKLEQLLEFDCFAKSFVYLASHLPRHQFIEPFDDGATVQPIEQLVSHLPGMKQITDDNLTQCFDVDAEAFVKGARRAVGRPADGCEEDVRPMSEAEPDMFPCVMVIVGSGTIFLLVDRDGSCKWIDVSNRVGKAFVAIGSVLTGAKTFDELIELAELGNGRNVDTYMDQETEHAVASESDNGIYLKATVDSHPSLLYCFGHLHGKQLGDLRREDVARSWLNYAVLDLAQCAQTVCLAHAVKRVIFGGSFVTHPFVRRTITTEFARRNLMRFMFNQGSTPSFDFAKFGGHLGALGCALRNMEQQLEKNNSL